MTTLFLVQANSETQHKLDRIRRVLDELTRRGYGRQELQAEQIWLEFDQQYLEEQLFQLFACESSPGL